MANVQISGLTAITTIASGDVIALDQAIGDLSKKITIESLFSAIPSRVHMLGDNINEVGCVVDTPTGQVSKLLDLQVNGVTKFSVNKDGVFSALGSNNYLNSIRNTNGMNWYQPITISNNGSAFSNTSLTLGGSTDYGNMLVFTATVNQSGTAGYRGLYLGFTETATGSGDKNLIQTVVGGATKFKVDSDGLITTASTTLMATSAALTDGAQAEAGTLANAPTAGDPTKWISIDDNGTTRYIPTWT